jgi:NCS1 family nucleobase:cation symporter-1
MAQTITGALERAETLPDWGIEPVPPDRRPLSGFDVGALWMNLGISITLPVVGAFLVPALSFKAALLAIVVGAAIGNLMLAAAARIGAETGAPTMVTYRGPLGLRGSYLPTAFNVMQNVGWGAFELYLISVVMAGLLDRYTNHGLRALWVVVFGAVCILMAFGGPVAVVRKWVRRYAIWLVIASSAYLTIYMLAKYDLGAFWSTPGKGGFPTFWGGVDLVIALPISWVPLVADYTRFARTGRSAFWGTGVGYVIAYGWVCAIGVLLVLG